MGHEDAGNYAAKHAPGTQPNPQIAELANQYASDGKITCADAHKIAHKLKISPAEAGKTIDLLELRLSQCQLGLFGYRPQRRIVQPAAHVSKEVRKHLEEAQTGNHLSCSASWELAEHLGLSRLEIASACEALGLKISSCQLGAF